MKKKYTVEVREVHISTREVEADSPEEARRIAMDGGAGDEIFFDYSHTHDPDTWSVYDENGKMVLD